MEEILRKILCMLLTSSLVNGDLDPWRIGAVLCDLGNPKIVVRLLNGGAHHLELRESNEADPQDVKDARTQFT
jgi:lysosomal Pro-X carboxypeptidase